MRWSGAQDKVWNDQQCPSLGNLDADHNLDACKKKCTETSSCTAFNFLETGGCVLRQCATPFPWPQWYLQGYKGYFIQENYGMWNNFTFHYRHLMKPLRFCPLLAHNYIF